ncbi:MAG: hypothetical protein ACPGWR_05410 [Ardenticatenaceae bacterium]
MMIKLALARHVWALVCCWLGVGGRWVGALGLGGAGEARKYWLDKVVIVRKRLMIHGPTPASPLQINGLPCFVDVL